MTISRIFVVLTVSITLIALAGCQEQQTDNNSQLQELAECRQENAELKARIEKMQLEYEKFAETKESAIQLSTELLIENENLRRENAELKETAKIKKKAENQTPEEKAKIKKGLQELFELRKRSAEKMKQDAQ